ncbi:lytic transglycosylase domain-containing protein [Oscillospiraceae bacterium MB08-C2-2]|nr:lytic transglycosylase domain-containing protein [Oscillospiraceae bacterium MB08-C2-2]
MIAKKRFRSLLAELLALAVLIPLLMAGFHWGYRYFYRSAYPVYYSEQVLRQSQVYDLPPELLYAVIRTESGFNPRAQSSVQARGLTQITPDTFEWIQFRLQEERELDFEDLYNPEISIQYGAALLRLYLDEFGSVETALCAYHAGRGSVLGWLKNPQYSSDGKNVEYIPFGDTSRYVARVIETRDLYRNLYEF